MSVLDQYVTVMKLYACFIMLFFKSIKRKSQKKLFYFRKWFKKRVIKWLEQEDNILK